MESQGDGVVIASQWWEGKPAGAARKMARVALEGRFGALVPDMLAAIEAAQEDALVAVVAHVTTDSLAHARARLGAPTPSGE